MARGKLKIRFRKDRGLWEVDYRHLDGVRRRPLFASEEAAHEHAREVFRRLGQSLPAVDDLDITLPAYAKRWLDTVAADKAPRTHARSATTRAGSPARGSGGWRELAPRSRHVSNSLPCSAA